LSLDSVKYVYIGSHLGLTYYFTIYPYTAKYNVL